MNRPFPEHIDTVDVQYFYPGRAAAYLLRDGDECAFVDNGTKHSAPHLMAALERRNLKPEQVRYLIVTHIHLDHGGGTAEMSKRCPRAQIICHPRAARHVVDPSRLEASARQVYGDEMFDQLYGTLEPIAEERVTAMEDSASLELGRRTLYFLDAPGHARHHFVVHDPASDSVLTGDAFGLCYPQLQHGKRAYFSYVCAPPEFDPVVGQETIRRIAALNPKQVYVTHFGPCQSVETGALQLLDALGRYDAIVDEAVDSGREDEALLEWCTAEALKVTQDELRAAGLDPEDPDQLHWALSEHMITSQGLAVLAQRRRKSRAEA